MIKFTLLIVTLLCSVYSTSISISGPILSDTILNADTIYVIGNVTVYKDITLRILPGTYVEGNGMCGIKVQGGIIKAEGTASDSIIFTSSDTTSMYKNWDGIDLFNTQKAKDTSVISFCRYEFARGGIESKDTSVIKINNCNIQKNSCGIHIEERSYGIITNNVIRKNRSGFYSAGIWLEYRSSAFIKDNEIYENTIGIGCWTNSNPKIINNRIRDNRPHSGDNFLVQGGIACESSSPLIIGNVIANNCDLNSCFFSGGIGIKDTCSPIIINNTIVNNALGDNRVDAGGIFCKDGATPIIMNNIIWGNEENQVSPSIPHVSYCAVENGFPGCGNFDIYPQFIDSANGEWSLSSNSYCINTGSPDTSGLSLPAKDMAGNKRIYTKIDIGAYEFQGDFSNPVLYISPYKIDTIVEINKDNTYKFQIGNSGSGTLTIDSIRLASGTLFSLVQNIPDNTPFQISELKPVTIKQHSLALGLQKDTLIIYNSFNTRIYRFPISSYVTGTKISGRVSGRWKKSNSPYAVISDLLIDDQTTLNIDPGVKILFFDNYKFTVKGRILARGTVKDTIIFTAPDSSIGWNTLRFDSLSEENDSSIISFCKLEHAKNTEEGFNNPPGLGGAIHVDHFSKLRISNCTIINNCAAGRSSGGGAIYCGNNSDIVIKNNHIENNQSYDKSALFLNNASPLLKGNTICKNIIGILAKRCNATISHNTIRDNRECGMDISGEPYISNNIIKANRETGVILDGGTLIHNIITDNSGKNGGGIRTSDTTSYIVNNLIANNSSESNGGGIYSDGDDFIINNTIVNNHAESGGAIYRWKQTKAKVINSIIWNNGNNPICEDSVIDFSYSNIEGGADGLFNINVYPEFKDTANGDFSISGTSPCINKGAINTSDLRLTEKDLVGNDRIFKDIRIDIGAYEFQGEGADEVITLSPHDVDTLITQDTDIDFSVMVRNDGLANLTIDSIRHTNNTNFTITQSIPANTTIAFSENKIVTVQFTECKPDTFYDTLLVYNSDRFDFVSFRVHVVGTIINTEIVSGTWTKDNSPYIIQNTITLPSDSSLTIEPGATILFSENCKFNVSGSLSIIGTASDSAILTALDTNLAWKGIDFINVPTTNSDTTVLSYCIIKYSQPDSLFGAMSFKSAGPANLLHCQIINNHQQNSYGLYCNNTDITIQNSKIANNNNGVFINKSSVTITESEITENYQKYTGIGMLCDSSTIILTDNQIIKNHTKGIKCYNSILIAVGNTISQNRGGPRGGGLYASQSEITLTDNTISSNSGNYMSGSGYGVLCVNSNLTAFNNIISKNGGTGPRSGGSGAGVYLNNTKATIENCIISGNYGIGGFHAVGTGSGISAYNDASAEIINCYIYNNYGSDYGAGVSSTDNSDISITNCTIIENRGRSGGGIRRTAGLISISNSIIWGNTPSQITDSVPTVSYSCIESGYHGINNIDQNPELAFFGEYFCAIDPSSPCVNRGNPDTSNMHLPLLDLAGNNRFYDKRIDIGVFEVQNHQPYQVKKIEDLTVDEDSKLLFVGDMRNYFKEDDSDDTLSFKILWNSNRQAVKAILDYTKHESGYALFLKFTPDSNGFANIIIKAFDNHRGRVTDTFTVTINPTDDSPKIKGPIKDTIAYTEKEYTLKLSAEDPDKNDAQGWAFIKSPATMYIGPLNGIIQWKPSETDIGIHPIQLFVVDKTDLSDTVSFNVLVEPTVGILNLPINPMYNTSMISAYPNPVCKNCNEIKFCVAGKISGKCKLNIYDALGNNVFTFSGYITQEKAWNKLFTTWHKPSEAAGPFLAVLEITDNEGNTNIYKSGIGVKK